MKKLFILFGLVASILCGCSKDEVENPKKDKVESKYKFYLDLSEGDSIDYLLNPEGEQVFTAQQKIFAVDGNDVYSISYSNSLNAVYKNGNLLYKYDDNYQYGVGAIIDGDIYTVFRMRGEPSINHVYKNEKFLYELEQISGERWTGVAEIKMNNHNLYFCGLIRFAGEGYNNDYSIIWQNDKILYKNKTVGDAYAPVCNAMTFDKNDIYGCGRDYDNLLIWKNGEVLYYFPLGDYYNGDLTAIVIFNGDVYSCGYIYTAEQRYDRGVVYKNNELIYQEGSSWNDEGIFYNLSFIDGDLYYSGFARHINNNIAYDTPTLWKNGEIVFQLKTIDRGDLTGLGSYKWYFKIINPS